MDDAIMLAPRDRLVLQLVMFLCWGSWSVVRRLSRWPAGEFMIVAIYAECFVAFGLLAYVDGLDSLGAAFGAIPTLSGALSLGAGACMVIGDYWITVMTDSLGVGVAAPMIFTTNIVFGSSLDLALTAPVFGAAPCRDSYFALGLACAVAGIFANVLSTPRPEDKLDARARGWRFGGRTLPLADVEAADTQADAITATAAAFAAKATAATPLLFTPAARPPPPAVAPSRGAELRSAASSLLLCVAVGAFSGGWSPLLTYAEKDYAAAEGDGALHACTQLGVAVTVTLVAAARALGGAGRRKRRRLLDDDGHLLLDDDERSCGAAAARGPAVPVATGALLALGYVSYFTVTSKARGNATSAVSYALGSCSSCIPMFCSYFVIGEYEHAPPRKHRLFLAAACLYAAAVFFLYLSDSGVCAPEHAFLGAAQGRRPALASRFPDRRSNAPRAEFGGHWAP